MWTVKPVEFRFLDVRMILIFLKNDTLISHLEIILYILLQADIQTKLVLLNVYYVPIG